jgi:hypothetical protein
MLMPLMTPCDSVPVTRGSPGRTACSRDEDAGADDEGRRDVAGAVDAAADADLLLLLREANGDSGASRKLVHTEIRSARVMNTERIIVGVRR